MTIEQVAAVVGVAVPVIAGLDLLIRWHFDSLRKALKVQADQANQRRQEAERERDDARKLIPPPGWVPPEAAAEIAGLKEQLDGEKTYSANLATTLLKAERARDDALAGLASASKRADAAEEGLRLAVAERDALREEVATHEKREASRNKLVLHTIRMEGKIWTQDVMHEAPAFLPLPERRVPVLSVLNLKGGVGKTTVTAYLAWGMARRGYRVLLIDLDLQGSLSSLFLPSLRVAERDQEGRNLRHFLAHAATAAHPKIQEFTEPAERLGAGSEILATTDRLAYEELNLTFQWLFRIGKGGEWTGRRDVRMLLRKALHRKGLAKKYDLVLLDCPPIVNLCCVNALAASDYVIVPVNPSRKALERVPPLLVRLREIQEKVNRDIEVMGVIANRVQQEGRMSPTEKDLWDALPQRCLDVYTAGVPRFETFLPQRASVRNAEDDFPPSEAEMLRLVDRLALEAESRLPEYCRRPQAAPAPAQASLFSVE